MATDIKMYDESSYIVKFEGDDFIFTTVTSRKRKLEKWLRNIYVKYRHHLNNLVVGLATSTTERQRWHDRSNVKPAAVLQLCVGHECLIYRICLAKYFSNDLCKFLQDDRFTFVGVGISNDVQLLYRRYKLEVKNTMELRILAADKLGKSDQHRRELRNAGFQSLVQEVMGVNLEKSLEAKHYPWEDEYWLSSGQIQYACAVAFVTFTIGRRLIACDSGGEEGRWSQKSPSS